jgi:phenylalanyl-tRNA synthetase beta chain
VDVAIEEDLVEEVARVVGYERIPSTLPGWGGSGAYLERESGRNAVRAALADLGFDEAISFSFVERDLDGALTCEALGGSGGSTEVLNPIIERKPRLRTSLLTGLVEAFETNVKHGARSVRLFEIGKRFLAGGERAGERETLGLVVSGMVDEHDYRARREADFFDIKGAVETVFERLGATGFTFERAWVEYLHPGQAAFIVREGEVLGVFGRVSPQFANWRKYRQPVFVAEIALDRLLAVESAAAVYKRLPKYPSVVRDVSIIVSRSVSYADVESTIRSLDVADLTAVMLYDVFTGEQIPKDQHSMTIRATFRSDDRTLTDEEVNAAHQRIVDELTQRFGATLRM